jgi:hypothetical protein
MSPRTEGAPAFFRVRKQGIDCGASSHYIIYQQDEEVVNRCARRDGVGATDGLPVLDLCQEELPEGVAFPARGTRRVF